MSNLFQSPDRQIVRSPNQFWRSLDELAGSPEFIEMLHREFPREASVMPEGPSRRRFLQVMAASLALAGLNACSREAPREIVPYVKQPEEIIPGKPLYFATSLLFGGYARGVLVESHEGRPTKIEGNPNHPASLGATDPWMQAEILTLYDPDRSTAVTRLGEIAAWPAFMSALASELNGRKADGGAGLRILTGNVTSPTLTAQLNDLLATLPGAEWIQYEPVGPRVGDGEPTYNFKEADVIVSLDCDFLQGQPGSVRYARDFGDRRRVGEDAKPQAAGMNRLYVVESMPSVTGAAADHRLALPPAAIVELVQALMTRVGGGASELHESLRPHERWINAAARDLAAHRGRSLVLTGDDPSGLLPRGAFLINQFLKNIGTTVNYPVIPPETPSLRTRISGLENLVDEMNAGRVRMLVMMGVNPVYNAPADFEFVKAMGRVPFRVHHGLYQDETSRHCHWHVPASHELEMWSDAGAFDGTPGIIQPLIAPLYGGRSHHEIAALLAGASGGTDYEIVREHWRKRVGATGFETWWRKSVHDGVITELPPATPSANASQTQPAAPDNRTSVITRQFLGKASEYALLDILFKPDPTTYDGRYANNGWLQELPKPLTKLTWDNAAMLSPATAARLGLENHDVVTLWNDGRTVDAPVWIVPGHADDCVTVHLGYGRRFAGRVAEGAGFNAYAIRASDSPWVASGGIKKTGRTLQLACTQDHHSMEGRDIVRTLSLDEFTRGKKGSAPGAEEEQKPGVKIELPQLSLLPEHDYSHNHAWGMVIDLTTCIGCNACVTACQSENNIPVVGKEQVIKGREMHWIRVDRYFAGPPESPELYQQPVTCMQCEDAPCEVVCPVGATQHSDEGLNEMVYNRCVGTRYCSNNCPYKVRRFNFLEYADKDTPSLGLMWNPDVTVRNRGVMEKCTYCIQRINERRMDAEKQDRQLHDGEIVTACQQACPTRAIIFGDLNDKKSKVAHARAQHHDYGLLTELNTRPRTSYLARVRNPNPEIAS